MNPIQWSEAKQQGLRFYFTGKCCSAGHIAFRYVSGRACTECVTINAKKSHEQLGERRDEYHKQWRESNRDRCAKATRDYRSRNPGYDKESNAKWRAENRHRLAANQSKRRAVELQAVARWANREAIAAMFEEAKRLTEQTGTPHHVDHIVPLNSKIVCGLHCEANMRVIPATDNISKGNRHWPDMP